MMAARANAYRQEVMKQRFEEYQDKAYDCYNKGDFNGFIFYSDYALNTGWYNSKLYYDRGTAIFITSTSGFSHYTRENSLLQSI